MLQREIQVNIIFEQRMTRNSVENLSMETDSGKKEIYSILGQLNNFYFLGEN